MTLPPDPCIPAIDLDTLTRAAIDACDRAEITRASEALREGATVPAVVEAVEHVATYARESPREEYRIALDALAALWLAVRGGAVLDLPDPGPPPAPERVAAAL